MKSINEYILEYKGHAIRDKEKSIGDPDEIKHYFAQGWVHLKFSKDNAYPYVYNKKLNKIIIGDANSIHNNIFNPKNADALKEMGLEDVKSVQQLRYCCGIDDDKEEIDRWYKENKQYVDNTICGRIWYDAQDDFETWDLDQQEQMAKVFNELKDLDSCKCYVANWNEISDKDFKKVNDNIVELFAKKHNKKIKTYIAIDNNGEPIELEVGSHMNIKIDNRSASHQKEINKIQAIHLASQKEKDAFYRGWKDQVNADKERELQKLGIRDGTYAKRNDKFAKHVVRDEKTGKYKVVYGAKIGDSLINYVNTITECKKRVLNDLIFDLDEESKELLSNDFKLMLESCNNRINMSMITEMSYGADRFKHSKNGEENNNQRGNREVWTSKDGDKLKMGDHATQRENRPVEKGGDGEKIEEEEIIHMFIYSWDNIMYLDTEGELEEIYDKHTNNYKRSFTTECQCYLVSNKEDIKTTTLKDLNTDGARPDDQTLWAAWMPTNKGYKTDIIIRTIFRGTTFKHGRQQERIKILRNGDVQMYDKNHKTVWMK